MPRFHQQKTFFNPSGFGNWGGMVGEEELLQSQKMMTAVVLVNAIDLAKDNQAACRAILMKYYIWVSGRTEDVMKDSAKFMMQLSALINSFGEISSSKSEFPISYSTQERSAAVLGYFMNCRDGKIARRVMEPDAINDIETIEPLHENKKGDRAREVKALTGIAYSKGPRSAEMIKAINAFVSDESI